MNEDSIERRTELNPIDAMNQSIVAIAAAKVKVESIKSDVEFPLTHSPNEIFGSGAEGERAMRQAISYVDMAISRLRKGVRYVETRRAEELTRLDDGKLSVADVKDMRDPRFKMMKHGELADMYGVTPGVVMDVRSRHLFPEIQ